MNDIRYDMSQFYPLKSVFENILGKNSYQKLKETASFSDWKEETKKLLKAIGLSLAETVKISDEDFHIEANQIIELGLSQISNSKEICELFSFLSATLARLVFFQMGFIPRHYHLKSVSLKKGNWNLSCIRSVQYVQNAEQKRYAEKLKGKNKTINNT